MNQGFVAAEPILYQQGTVTVTPSRFHVGLAMYPVRGVTAVYPREEQQGSRIGGIILIIIGVFTLIGGLNAFLRSDEAGFFLILGLMVVTAGVWTFANAKKVFHITITTSGMNTQAYSTANLVEAQQIIAALHEAIAALR